MQKELITKIGVIPRDEDTKTLFHTELIVRSLDAVHQVWVWSEIKGESLIFKATDVVGLDDDALKGLLDASGLRRSEGQVTISRSNHQHVFLNFDFDQL